MIAIVTRLPLAMLLAFTVAVTCVHAQAPTPTAAPAADADRIAAAKGADDGDEHSGTVP